MTGKQAEPSSAATAADEYFAANVREARERTGMSQSELAKQMADRGWRYYPQTVQRIEAGERKVSVGEGKSLAEILHTTVDRLTWPGTEVSAARLLDEFTGRAQTAYRQITASTRALLWAQHQLTVTLSEAETTGLLGSAPIRPLARDAAQALEWEPEDAVAEGRDEDEMIREAAAGGGEH